MGMEAQQRNQPAEMGFRKTSSALFWHNVGDKGDREAYFPTADNGCEFSPKCVDCPLVACRHDYEGMDDISGAAMAISATLEQGEELNSATLKWVHENAGKPYFKGEAALTARRLARMVGKPMKLSKAEHRHIKDLARSGLRPRTIARRLLVKERVITKYLEAATL